jgi:hypothetical protein
MHIFLKIDIRIKRVYNIKAKKNKMPDYSKGKIYTIRCRIDDTLIYVGSTTQSLAVRFGGHKRKSKEDGMINRKIYNVINGDWNNWYIELYSLYPCNSKEELCKKEGEIIRLIGNLNNNIEGRTEEEFKECYIQRSKLYREKNPEKVAECTKIYREKNPEKVKKWQKEWYENNKDKSVEYREKYKDKITKYHKEYYENNKDKIKEYRKIKITCECGCIILKMNIKKHIKTQTHLDLINKVPDRTADDTLCIPLKAMV